MHLWMCGGQSVLYLSVKYVWGVIQESLQMSASFWVSFHRIVAPWRSFVADS